MTENISLRDQLMDATVDMEALVKMIVESVMKQKSSKERGNAQLVRLTDMFDDKRTTIVQLLRRVSDFQAREELIKELKSCVLQRDEIIQQVERNLKACEGALTNASFIANQRMKTLQEAELRPVNSEVLVKLAHQISKHFSVSAPLTWQQGDPSRPFPQEHEFRAGQLLTPQTQSKIPNGGQFNSPFTNRATSSPMVNSKPLPREWSPRTGYGPPTTSPLQLAVNRGATPNAKQWAQQGSSTNLSPFQATSQSPSSSPNVKLKITGLPTVAATAAPLEEVRNVEQMSSDSSDSSASSDEDEKK